MKSLEQQDFERVAEILRNALYTKHPRQTERERVDNALRALQNAGYVIMKE